MTLSEFKLSVNEGRVPEMLSPLLKAMWYDAQGNWEAAHDLAQDDHSGDGSWIHAYLHRKEGDLGNASYWYSRANKPVAKNSLNEEWEDICKALIG